MTDAESICDIRIEVPCRNVWQPALFGLCGSNDGVIARRETCLLVATMIYLTMSLCGPVKDVLALTVIVFP